MLGFSIFKPVHLGTLLLLAMLTRLCDAQLISSLHVPMETHKMRTNSRTRESSLRFCIFT